MYKDYIIVDTSGQDLEFIMQKEITPKFILKASLILYTAQSLIPLGETHDDILKWIQFNLMKTDSTIFALNKMDEFDDLEDEPDFNQKAIAINKGVLSKLRNITNTS